MPPNLLLRDYQEKAIEQWFGAECRGFFEMATGTGKTITALAASARLAEREGRLATIIAAPYQHLVDQWSTEAERFGHRPVLAYRDRTRWVDDAHEQAVAFSAGLRPYMTVITTHVTFATPAFQSMLARLSGPVLLIADEVHHMGTDRIRRALSPALPFRLGLSATPDRWFDDIGTQALREYFGATVFALPLADAIGISLTPYYYHPHLVELTESEFQDYRELTTRIARLFGRTAGAQPDALQRLLAKRADLLNMAANKLEVLSNLVDEEGALSHALFYCAPGQLTPVVRLLGWEKDVLVHPFTARETAPERRRLLAEFADGRLQALAAIRCLDEGVDVPSTRLAFLLASSGNPREFTQRRGRLLRRAAGKSHAVIHDLIAVPPVSQTSQKDSSAYAAERAIVRRELDRFGEFAGAALNKHTALDAVWDLAVRYNLTASQGGADADR
jgi:superfamily II DNA or RNA helicase